MMPKRLFASSLTAIRARRIVSAFLFSLILILTGSCSIEKADVGIKQENKKTASPKTELGTSNSKFLDRAYITQSLDFALYKAWISLDEAISEGDTVKITAAQNIFLQELEKEKNLKTYRIADGIYGIQNQLKEMEKACLEQDAKELARLVTAFYISKGLLYQKSGTIFMQLIISMSILLLLIILLLLFYQFTYTLVLQNFGLILSAFLARLPVNLFDKALAVFGGFGIFCEVRKIIKSTGETDNSSDD